jgi:hypothetical protein
MPEYECKCCGFSTVLKTNYTTHLRTYKHIRKTQVKPKALPQPPAVEPPAVEPPAVEPLPQPLPPALPVSVHEIKCKKCNKHFKFKQSMYRHIKYTCKIPDPEPVPEIGVKELFSLLKKQRDEFNKKIDYQTKQIERLIGEKSETETI